MEEELITTGNCLADIIGWLKKDIYVVIHSRNGRFFINANKDQMNKLNNILKHIDLYM